MPKILVIEDEAELREEVADWLSLEDHEVLEASDGVEGIESAIKNHPDLIICDIAMPRLDGYGVLLELQSSVSTIDIPFIFVTARASREDIRYGMTLGADDYITKPFSRTELLQAIQARLKKKAVHEQTLQQEGALIENALRQEKERNLVRSRMVAMVSHDFRTPLAVISTCNSLLRDYSDRLTPERRKLQMNRIEASVRQLLNMLDEMLIVAQSESGLLDCEPGEVELSLLVQSIVDEFQFINAESHKIVFEKRFTGTVYADADLIRHLVANLLSNAIKYSRSGTEVSIVVDLDPNERSYWSLQVRDNGIGISEEDIEHLFTPFHRGANVGKIKGTGLGLGIVKQVVELHGGEIAVQSKVGEGTTFAVRVPIRPK